MSTTAKTVCAIIGLLFLIGGVALILQAFGGGIPLIGLGALILIGLALEPRYGRPRDGDLDGRWQRTGERFIDDESGEPVEVWYDARSGKRRYAPLSDEG